MLDHFLDVAYEKTAEVQAKRDLTDTMSLLPESELRKIASSGVIGIDKAAFGFGSECGWLEKFKGTPLFDKALELEQEELENEVQQTQQRAENSERYRAEDAQRDQMRVQRKMLELELARLESGGGGEGPGDAEPGPAPAAPPPPPPPPAPAPGPKTEVKVGSVLDEMAYSMKVAAGMAPTRAGRITRGELQGVVEDNSLTAANAATGEQEAMQAMADRGSQLQGRAAYAQEHPVLSRMPGAAAGGILGALGGAAMGGGGRAALIGGAMGGLAGAGLGYAVSDNPAERSAQSAGYQGAQGVMQGDVLRNALVSEAVKQQAAQDQVNAVAVAEAGASNITQSTNVYGGGGGRPSPQYGGGGGGMPQRPGVYGGSGGGMPARTYGGGGGGPGVYGGGGGAKYSSAQIDEAAELMLGVLEKDAGLGGAVLKGVQGLGRAVKGGFQASKIPMVPAAAAGRQGMGGALTSGKNYMKTMMKKDPRAAATMIGGAGLAAGGAAGYAAG